MDISLVVAQLRQYCPSFAGNVGCAVEYSNALTETANLPLPAAYVLPLEDRCDDNEFQNGLRQTVRERIAIIVETDATADLRGNAAAFGVEAMKYAVFTSLLNWRIDPIRAQKGLQYSGGHLVQFDRRRVFWEYDFDLIVTITDEDGFQLQSVPISEIDAKFDVGTDTLDARVYFSQMQVAAVLAKPTAQVSAS